MRRWCARRQRRLLWDQFHSVRYPPAYIPRDSLEVRTLDGFTATRDSNFAILLALPKSGAAQVGIHWCFLHCTSPISMSGKRPSMCVIMHCA